MLRQALPLPCRGPAGASLPALLPPPVRPLRPKYRPQQGALLPLALTKLQQLLPCPTTPWAARLRAPSAQLTKGPLRTEYKRIFGSVPNIDNGKGGRKSPPVGWMQDKIKEVLARGKRPWTTFPKGQKPY